jgi:hypothetical protein
LKSNVGVISPRNYIIVFTSPSWPEYNINFFPCPVRVFYIALNILLAFIDAINLTVSDVGKLYQRF